MMELTTCAFIVTLVSLVTATPYGYGVKGGAGAVARADSSALTGAFGTRGDIPDVPFGNGFSGSFSKSSASSSSSSSASSSSSSSSFSYSGARAGGFSSPGTNGNTACTFGSCQNSGTNEISGNHGSNGAGTGLHGYSGANSGAISGSSAATGSGAIPGANCLGSTCDNNSGKCSSGKCTNTLQTDTSLTHHDSNAKCNSGQCGTPLQTGPSASQYDSSDDLKFVAHSSNSADDSKELSSDYDKTTEYTGGSNCYGGNCGSSTTVNSQPTFSQGSPNSYHKTDPSNYQKPTNSNTGVTPGYNSPATHLEAPKQSFNCNSGSCDSGQSGQGHGSPPSSYNVPIHGSYDNNKQKPSCADGKCEYPQKGSYSATTSNSLSTNYLLPQDLQATKGPFSNYPSSNCGGLTCSSGPSNTVGTTSPSGCSTPNCNPHYSASAADGVNGKPGKITYPEPADKVTGVTSPSYIGPSGTYSNKPTFASASTGCTSPDCSSQVPSIGANPLSTYNSIKPSVSNENLPTYTGGFGGPVGMLKPNEFTIPTSTKPIYPTSPTYNVPSTIGCKTPNCIGSYPGGITTAQSGSYGTHKESGTVPVTNDKLPTYTGSFGGPTGMLKPNDFDIKGTNKPTYSATPSYNSQPSTSSTTGCKTPNCNAYTPVVGVTSKPNADADSTSELPLYTGGFGGPSGFLKPNQFNPAHNAPGINNPYTGVLPSKIPTSNVLACTTPNCGPSVSAPSNPQSLFGAPKPNISPSSITFPGYSSNYRPIGVTKPSAPAVAPISISFTQPLHPTGTYTTGCKTGNCGTYPDVNAPSGSYGNPTECKFGNCGTYPATGPDVNAPSAHPNIASKPSGSYSNPAGCKTGNCVTYSTSGSDVNSPSGSYDNPTKCKTGNCDIYAATGPDVNTPSANPNAALNPTGSYSNSAGCKTGNCGTYPTSGSDVTAPSGSYGNPTECKTGNCGAYPATGPDANVPSASPIAAPKPSGSYGNSPGCKTGNCGIYLTSGSDVSAPSGSYGNPTECKTGNCGAYPNTGPDFNVPSVNPNAVPKPSGSFGNSEECKTGNCGAYPTGGSNINAPSGSYGVTNGNTVPKPSNPLYTGGFGRPSESLKPNDHALNAPTSNVCKTSDCANHPSAIAGATAQSGSYTGSKQQLPAYTGGFGAPSGLLKPNEYSNPSVTPVPSKPSPNISLAATCTSGSCNPKGPSSTGHDVALNGGYASASSSASANAVIYSGGFGGPPGFLKPYDDGKVDLTKLVGGQNLGSHYGGANINFPHDAKAGTHESGGTTLNTGVAGLTNTGALGGSAGGATAYSGSVASANSGSYTHGAHQAGNGGCDGGCGGGYQSSGSSAGAGAKSLSNAGSYGGSFASSSASAHSSAGAYTKGGYGKR